MPKVSVIIPTYNKANCICETIDSVLKQIFKDYEIIVVDDGSTDNTREVLAKYNRRIRYFYQENIGVSSARNMGIREAKGEYIAFLDSDDNLLAHSLYKRINFLDSYREVPLVFTDYNLNSNRKYAEYSVLKNKHFLDFFKKEIGFRKNEEIIFTPKFIYKYLAFSPLPVWVGTVMIRNDLIKNTGLFKEELRCCEDTEYWIRIIKKHIVGYINEPLSIYNYICSGFAKQEEKYNLEVIKFYEGIILKENDKIVRYHLKRKLGIYYCSLAYHYGRNSSYIKAIKNLLMAIMHSPKNIDIYKKLLLALIPNRIKEIMTNKHI